jgi:hypothetical protein
MLMCVAANNIYTKKLTGFLRTQTWNCGSCFVVGLTFECFTFFKNCFYLFIVNGVRPGTQVIKNVQL